jgi:hypothetical protein
MPADWATLATAAIFPAEGEVKTIFGLVPAFEMNSRKKSDQKSRAWFCHAIASSDDAAAIKH